MSVEPFLFNILRSGNGATPAGAAPLEAATALYGVDLGVMMLIMGIFTVALVDEEKKLLPKDMVRTLRSEAISWLVGGVIFVVSAAPVFGGIVVGGTLLRTGLWFAALIAVWTRRYARKVTTESR